MRGDLGVRISDGYSDRIVTRHVRDLSFTKTAPGGHHTARCRLLLPRDTFRDLGPADAFHIFDGRTARPMWSGYATNPTPTDGPSGQEWDMSATGGVVIASDQNQPLAYVDRELAGWELHYQRLAQMSAGSGSRPNEDAVSGLLYQFPRGIAVNDGYSVSMRYELLDRAGLLLGGFRYYMSFGITDANYTVDALTEDNTLVRSRNAATGAAVLANASSAGSEFSVGQQAPRIRWIRNAGGATNIANDNTWAHVSDVWVRMLLHDLDGTQISGPGAYPTGRVLASQVAADLVGRGALGEIDAAASTVEASTFEIDQLAYHDGARAAQVLDDLALYEPDFLWEILHSTSRGHIFNYRAWPTTPRYEITTSDGYEEPGSDVDLCNRIVVYWTDANGNRQTTVVTADVPALGTRTRDADAIELPAGRGSAANAQRIGEQVLAAKADPPKAARATVGRPIMDRKTGSLVMPWEIEPGYLVRVRETGEDLRLTEMEYVDNDGAARLTLGEPELTESQRIARLSQAVAS